MVADQLYSLILTAVIGASGPIGDLRFTVAIGRAFLVVRTILNVDRMGLRGGCRQLFNPRLFVGSLHPIVLLTRPLNMPTPVSKPRTLYDKIWDDHVMYVTFNSCDRQFSSLFLCKRHTGRRARPDLYRPVGIPSRAVRLGRVVMFVLGISCMK